VGEWRVSGTAVLICGHGSRDGDAIREFEAMAAQLRPRLAAHDFAAGYLEFARPTIREALEGLAAGGARRVFAVPAMLFAASHVKNDLPWEINSFRADNPDTEVMFSRDLAVDAKLLAAAVDRIAAAAPERREDALLLVVGRGTNDPDANSNIAKLARMLWEGMGFGWAETGFSGVAHPRVDAALDRAARLGFRRIVVFPYFLFTGVLVKRIYAQMEEAAARFPDIEFVKALYLRDHPLVLDTFIERASELVDGDGLAEPKMNCQFCKYRSQIVGYEADAGAPQRGHHHHVRGIGTDDDHHHHHDHPHDPDHHHDHHHR
jgi:sirohydrochlorin cobaltochelatase